MSVISKLKNILVGAYNGAKRAIKYPGVPLRDPALVAMLGGSPSSAGVDVDESAALNYSAVWQATTLIASNVAAMPVAPYEYIDSGRRLAKNTPQYKLMAEEPNPEMTPFVFHETLTAHCVNWGNAYAKIDWDGDIPIAIWPLMPDQVVPRRDDAGQIYYDFIPKYSGEDNVQYKASEILHIPGMGFDGLQGYNVIQLAREAIGLGLATEQYGASFFGRGSIPSGIIETPLDQELTEQARKNLRESFELIHRGPSNSHRVAILEGGMTYKALGLPPEVSQFLQTRQFQVVEIARWYNIPPHLLRDLTHATYSNIEHQGIDFLTYTLRPWLLRWQQEYHRKLFNVRDRHKYCVDHDTNNLLLTDTVARYNAYQTGRYGGWLTLNEIRQRERLPALPSDIGDTHLMPVNTTILGRENIVSPISIDDLTKVTDYLKSNRPVSYDSAKNIINAVLPGMTDQAVQSLIGELQRSGVVYA
jgi:HK97 family phage portal protein